MKTYRKIALISLLVLAYGHFAQAQLGADCPNLNFSQGNFTNWTCKTSNSFAVGNTGYSYLTWVGSLPVTGRHTIMTDIYGYDNHTCNGTPNTKLALVPDGFNQSARIGNDYTMSEADAIIYQMTVDSNNALLLLHFAIVFDDPSHSPQESPMFEIRLQDANGVLLNIPCNRYVITGGSGIPGFQNCTGSIMWKDWTSTGISLDSLIGQTIYIVISSADCSAGGHFGYGYFVGECRPMMINDQYCCKSAVGRFEAPEGFVSYVWRDVNGNIVGNNQKLSIQNPNDSSVYTVTMTSAMGCTSVLTCKVDCHEVEANFICDSTTYKCFPTGVLLADRSSTNNGEISYGEWNISKISEQVGTEYVSADTALTYVFKDTGFYKIFYTVYDEDGCGDTASTIVYSYPAIDMDLNIHSPNLICKNTETEIYATGAAIYEWTAVKRVQSDTSAIIDRGGMYIVKGSDSSGCAYDTAYVDDLEFSIDYTTINNKCNGYDSGEIKITKITGEYIAPMYHYWEDLGYTNGVSTKERKNLTSGNYVVYSIDDYGCYRYDTITVRDLLPLGSIGAIKGDSVAITGKNYTYYLIPVQNARYYHWIANEITGNGNLKLLDTITNLLYITLHVINTNPIEISVYAFNECDTGQQVSKLIQCENSIKEYARNEKFVIYPNPTSDILNIKGLNGIIEEVILYDIVGKEVKREVVNRTECIISLENLPQSIYILKIKTQNTYFNFKIIKR